MNLFSKNSNGGFWSLILIAVGVFLNAGCGVEEKRWIDKMLSEMEAAWIEADQARLGQEGRVTAVAAVARKYFHPKMSKAEAFKLMGELKADGFRISEYRHEGARSWPYGEIKPYTDEPTRRNFQNLIPLGYGQIFARKKYGSTYFIITKSIGITIAVSDGRDDLVSATGAVGLDSI